MESLKAQALPIRIHGFYPVVKDSGPKGHQGYGLGTRVLKYWVLGPFESGTRLAVIGMADSIQGLEGDVVEAGVAGGETSLRLLFFLACAPAARCTCSKNMYAWIYNINIRCIHMYTDVDR